MRALLCLMILSLVSCVSFDSEKKKKVAPKITDKMSLNEALANGIEFGGVTLHDVEKLVKRRKEWPKAEEHLYKILMTEGEITAQALINTMELFRASRSLRAPEVFKQYVRDGALLKRQLAWQLASDSASEKMGHEIEVHLTESIAENELNLVFIPAMADAVASNRLVESYSVVREGLLFGDDIAFARAMIALKPQQASTDFLEYLAKAPIEELRQLSLKSVDVYTCTLILEHLASYPPPASHPRMEVLFLYAISRNNALGEMARDVLEKYLPQYSEAFAFTLSRLPSWMQIAFVERSSKRMTPVISIFLNDLKKVTADKDVVDEISELKI